MDDDTVDELGPVDWIVVEFPGSRFTGQIAPALRDLVERDLVRVLDLLVLKKDADGTLESFELSDLDHGEIGELRMYEAQLAMLLSEEDVTSVAAAIEPGSSAAVLVWENLWAAPFASAVRRSGVSWWPVAASPSRPYSQRSKLTRRKNRTRTKQSPSRRADQQSERKESEMPLARRRMRRGGVVGPAPVARTAATVATVAVVAHGVNRRSDRREDRRDDRRDRRD